MSSQIYKWCCSPRNPEYIGADENSDAKISWSDHMRGIPLPDIEDWVPPVLTQYLGEHGRRSPLPPMDIAATVDGFVISENAVEQLQDVWNRHATLYPVVLDDAGGGKYWMVVVNTVLDCLDRNRSKGPLQKYGPTPDLFALLYEWVFDENCVGDAELFVIPDSPTIVYATERFKNRVIDSGLKGICLRTEWYDEDEWHS